MLPFIHYVLLASPLYMAFKLYTAALALIPTILIGVFICWWCVKVEELVNPFNRVSEASITASGGGSIWNIRNWGNNHSWSVPEVARPKSLDELINLVKRNPHGRIKPFGCLHSWSQVAMTKGMAVDMKGLNRVLEIDDATMTVTVEAGILLRDLFAALNARGLALETMPNVNHVTVGGVLANAVHGTNASIGTFGDQVQVITMVTAAGEVMTLRRDDEKLEQRDLFDAVLVSFGVLGIVYSVKVRIVPSYAVIKTVDTIPFNTLLDNLPSIARRYPQGLQVACYPKSNFAVTITKTNVDPLAIPTVMRQTRDPMLQLNMALLHKVVTWPDWKWFPLQSMFLAQIPGLATNISCVRWDLAEVNPNHTYRFINMEYGIPESRIKQAVIEVTDLIKQSTCKMCLLRIVGPDSRGFLSPTLRTEDSDLTFYVDIPYRPSERELFAQVEKTLLRLGGRVSMARWFVRSSPDLFQNVPAENLRKFREIRDRLDPNRIFTNDLVDQIFSR